MLKSTFTCFSGISESAEQKLWNRGCLHWRHFVIYGYPLFSQHKTSAIQDAISEAEQALALGRVDYFLYRLPPAHKPRVLADFASQIAYLDVETTGLSRSASITTVVVYHAGELYFFINGYNLFDLLERLMQCQLLVTFNGTHFDLPLLERRLGIQILVPHLDLLPIMRALGLKGGLKAIEKHLSIERSCPCNGKDAVQLWHLYQATKSLIPLTELLTYNAEDTINLEMVLTYAFKRSIAAFPLEAVLPLTWKRPQVEKEARLFLSNSSLTSS